MSRHAFAIGLAVLVLVACESQSPKSNHPPPTTSKRVIPALATLTPATGGGVRPILAWQPVKGAAKYRVVVLDAKRRPYWAWEGTTIKVPMGGGTKPAAKGSDGPRIGAGFSVVGRRARRQGQADQAHRHRPDQPLTAPTSASMSTTGATNCELYRRA